MSWWPADQEKILDYSPFLSRTAEPSPNYKTDKNLEISDRTEERLEEAELAHQEIAQRRLEPVSVELSKKAAFFPKAAQKKAQDGKWGISAQKVYLPRVGENRDVLSADKKKSKFILFGLHEKAMLDDVERLKRDAKANKVGFTWASKTENCASITARMLISGGAESFLPFSSAWIFEDPNKVHEYAKSVQKEIDQLNHKADNIANYSKDLLTDRVISEAWNHFTHTQDGAFFSHQSKIDELKSQLEGNNDEAAIQTIKDQMCGHHQNHVELIHSHFKEQVATLTPTEKEQLAGLSQAMEQYKPDRQDDLSTLMKKAKELVEAIDKLLTQQKDAANVSYNPAILTAHAMLKKAEDFMALEVN